MITTAEIEKFSPKVILDNIRTRLKIDDALALVGKLSEVKSDTAKFQILDVALSQSKRFTFEQAKDRWLQEVRGPLTQIWNNATLAFSTRFDRAAYFILHVAVWLRSHILEDELRPPEETPEATPITCPYQLNASNFIYTLLETNVCRCNCYSDYLFASAEEFDCGDIVRTCALDPIHPTEDKHQSVVIIRPTVVEQTSLAEHPQILDYMNIWYRYVQRHFVMPSKWVNATKDSLLFLPRIEAQIETAYLDTIAVGVTLRTDSTPNKWYQYVDDLNEGRVTIFVRAHASVDRLECVFPASSKWVVIENLLRVNAWKKGFWSSMKGFLLIGKIFRIEDVVDLLIQQIITKLEWNFVVIENLQRQDKMIADAGVTWRTKHQDLHPSDETSPIASPHEVYQFEMRLKKLWAQNMSDLADLVATHMGYGKETNLPTEMQAIVVALSLIHLSFIKSQHLLVEI